MKPTIVMRSSTADLARFGPAPRDVRLTANGKALVVLAIVFAAAAVAAAIGLPIVRAAQQAERNVAEREGVAADATITRLTLTRGEHPHRTITFRYSAPDGVHESTVRLPQEDKRTVAEGDHFTISYLRSRPGHSWVAGDEPGVLPLLLLPLLPIVPLLVTALIAWRVRRDCVLLAEGRFATARVISSKKISRSHHHAYRTSYEFTTLSGATVTGRTERGRPLGAIGANVAIVYHRENPKWNAIYPLSLATLVRA